MEWMQGPMSDQAIFWLGVKVYWWKRLIAVVQMVLGSSILLTLVTAEQKRKLSDALEERGQRAEGVFIPPVIRFRTVAKWFGLGIALLSPVMAFLTHLFVQQNHEPFPFVLAWLLWGFLLALLSLPMAEIIIAISMLRTGIRGAQHHVPKLLAWFLHHERFDRHVTIAVFVALVLVSSLQILLS